MSTIEYKSGDIHLFPVPHADDPKNKKSKLKKRPVVILTKTGYNQKNRDVVVCGMTTKSRPEETVEVKADELLSGELPKDSNIVPTKITAAAKHVLHKPIGRVKHSHLYEAIGILKNALSSQKTLK